MIIGKRFVSRRPGPITIVWTAELMYSDRSEDEVRDVLSQLSDEQFSFGNTITISDIVV